MGTSPIGRRRARRPGKSRLVAFALCALALCLGAALCGSLEATAAGERSGRAGENLLRNASFLQATNRPIPDHWDLHHAAALAFRDLHKQYYLSDREASPVPGTKALVIVNGEQNFYHAILLPQLLFRKLPEGSYTFSVYAKSSRANAEMLIGTAWGEPKAPVKKLLGEAWQRYAVTFQVGGAGANPPQPMLYFPSNAVYLVAAPQLEYGCSASPFRPCPEDAASGATGLQAAPGGAAAIPGSSEIAGARRRAGREGGGKSRQPEVDRAPFFMIGMEVGGPDTLPEWYLDDLAGHGINTLFLSARLTSRGDFDLLSLERLLARARSHGLKVVVGRPLMGVKDPDWRRKTAAFLKLIRALKDEPAIIGWEPVDEPAASTWSDAELLEIRRGIKEADPLRPVFMNWAYDGVPAEIGREPRGTLQAADFYSTDYYPFAGEGRSLADFTGYSVRALETARIFGKIPHAWIQLYGGMDAWREPTGAELNYMVYLNLLYGGSYSYWNTKSNSRAVWSRVAEINRQAKTLARELFLNPQARELRLPERRGNFTFSVWDNGGARYLIVLHNGQGTETLDFDLSLLVGVGEVSVRSLFEHRQVAPAGEGIRESFAPYQSRVYLVTAAR